MFTGIIEEQGTVHAILHGNNSAHILINAHEVCIGSRAGDSIAVNGVCLTITRCSGEGFTADVMPETLSRSALGFVRPGSTVNLERALTLSSRLGGHIVSGHIDGTGRIRSIIKNGIAHIYQIECDANILRYIIAKGSVALNGISLTVCEVTETYFTVSLIPETFSKTNFGTMKEGGCINIECDMIGKYIEKLLTPTTHTSLNSTTIISESFLQMHGFTEV